MPHQPTIVDSRFVIIVACLEPAIELMDEIDDAFGTPFTLAIANTTSSLVTAVQVLGLFGGTYYHAHFNRL